MIRFEGVTKRYAGAPGHAPSLAVDDLTLTAPAGQITVLVGPSGCGKTTTLRMVNRMVAPTSGTIWLDERDTDALDPAELRADLPEPRGDRLVVGGGRGAAGIGVGEVLAGDALHLG